MKHLLLVKRVNEIDKIYTKLLELRREAMLLLQEKARLEKKILKGFKKHSAVVAIETKDRVYARRKRRHVDEREKCLQRLINDLQRDGKNAAEIEQWKNQEFKKTPLKAYLSVSIKNEEV